MEKTTLKEMVIAYQQTATPAIKEEVFETIVDVVNGLTYEVYGMTLDACIIGGIFETVFEKYKSPKNNLTDPCHILGKLSRIFYFMGDFYEFADIRYDVDKDEFVFIDENKRKIVSLDAKYFEDETKCLQMELDIIINHIKSVLVGIDCKRDETEYNYYRELLEYFQERKNLI